MKASQLAGILRIIVPVALSLFGGMLGKSLLPEDSAALTDAIVNATVAVLTAISVAWSWWANSRLSQISRVANLPEVRAVVAEPQIANGALRDNQKVVTGQRP